MSNQYTFDEKGVRRIVQSVRATERLLQPKPRTLRHHSVPILGTTFAVRVWRDGGTTDGSQTTQCDRTYTVRTLDATAVDTGGVLLGEDMTPVFRPSDVGLYITPAVDGEGVVGVGYYDEHGDFALYSAGEQLDAGPC